MYSLSQQGLSSGAASTSSATDEATSPRLKKKRMTSSNLENTADAIKDAEQEVYQGQTSVAELSMQLLNEQRLRMRLEERLKSLEQHAANVTAPQANTSAPVTAQTQPVLPTQPLKMEVVSSAVKVPSASEVRPPPAAILLTDKNGIRVEVETVAGLPSTPVSLQIAPKEPTAVVVQAPQQPTQQPQPSAKAAEELKTKTPSTTGNSASATRSFIVTSTAAANAGRHNLDSIVEAIRHLEGDHCFSEDHKVTIFQNSI